MRCVGEGENFLLDKRRSLYDNKKDRKSSVSGGTGGKNLSNNPITREISEYIKEQIMTGCYREGDKISERTISERFDVSRTLAREALVELKQNGWVRAEHKSGTYVAPLDLKRTEDNYKARMALEPVTLMMAFPNLTEHDILLMKENCEKMSAAATPAEYSRMENDQHRILCGRINNRYVEMFINSMMEDMTRVGSRVGQTSARREKCVDEWKGIIGALERKDSREAAMLFSEHIRASFTAFIKSCAEDET